MKLGDKIWRCSSSSSSSSPNPPPPSSSVQPPAARAGIGPCRLWAARLRAPSLRLQLQQRATRSLRPTSRSTSRGATESTALFLYVSTEKVTSAGKQPSPVWCDQPLLLLIIISIIINKLEYNFHHFLLLRRTFFQSVGLNVLRANMSMRSLMFTLVLKGQFTPKLKIHV